MILFNWSAERRNDQSLCDVLPMLQFVARFGIISMALHCGQKIAAVCSEHGGHYHLEVPIAWKF